MRYSGHSCCISFFTLCCILNSGTDRSPYSHQRRALLGVRANVQPKFSIPIGAKVEISPKGFSLGVKAERGKNYSICPRLQKNAELYGLVLDPRLKKGYHQIWEANSQHLGPMFQHLLIF
jgi:hypothetical protein